MVQIKLAAWEGASAVLACVAVPNENIPTTETDRSSRNPVVGHENQHPRNPYRAPDKPYMPFLYGNRQSAPGRIVKQLIVFVYRLGKACVQKAESAAQAGNVDRKESTIKDKNAGVQHKWEPAMRNMIHILYPSRPKRSIVHQAFENSFRRIFLL